MEGNSPGSSKGCSSTQELRSKQGMEERENSEIRLCSWASARNRDLAPFELPKLPTRCRITVKKGEVDIEDMISKERMRISLSDCLRTLPSSDQDVETLSFSIWCTSGENRNFVGAVCGIVKNMPSVKTLRLDVGWDGGEPVEFAEAISKWVAGNSTLIALDLGVPRSIKGREMKLLVDAISQNQALKEFGLTIWVRGTPEVGSILKELCRYVKNPNNVLTWLDILTYSIDSKDEVESLAALICNNNTRLKRLYFVSSNRECGGLNTFWDNLGSNTVLESLAVHSYFWNTESRGLNTLWDNLRSNTVLKKLLLLNVARGKYDKEAGTKEMKGLVEMLIPNPRASGVQPNSSLHILHISGLNVGIEGLATLLQSNTSLLELTLHRIPELMLKDCECAYDNVQKILTSLQSNVSLELLDLSWCTAIKGKRVLGMIMDMLLHNHTIKKIGLSGTPLKRDGDDVIVNVELSKREEDNLWTVVQGMDTINPDSARLFLCGKELAGKTTLSSTWRSSHSTFSSVQSHGTCFDVGEILRKLFACTACKSRKTKNMIKLDDQANELKNERTRGIEVHNMNVEGVNISIWDMAGQEEYHTFHDWMIPNRSATGNCCIYVLLCDPTCKDDPNGTRDINKIKQELLYWLQFVASNTRRSFGYRPHVTIVFTHADLWGNKNLFTHLLKVVIDEFRVQFEDLLEVDTHDKPFFIDTRSKNDASTVLSSMHSASKCLLERLPKEIKACKILLSIIQEKNKRGDNIPFLKWSDFSLMCEKIDGLKSSDHTDETTLIKTREFVATSLHDGGFIIYFKGIDIVILDPQWFCHDIMGEFLFHCTMLDPNLQIVKDGVISKNHLQNVFITSFAGGSYGQYFDAFLKMMTRLQVCYEQDNDNIMIPSTLQETEEMYSWQHIFDNKNMEYKYVGTRLASQDETLTILTSGFFPRLQVFLRTKLSTHNIYKSYKNIISYIDNGNEIIITCDDGAINIMSRSSRRDHTVHKRIINAINELRSISTLGCPGVIFEEYIMRPQCVQRWFKGMDVRMQVASKKELRTNVLLCPDLNYQRHWHDDDRFELGMGCDWVKDLLGDEEWEDALQKRGEILKNMNKHVQRILEVAFDDVERDPCNKTIVSDQEYVEQTSFMTNDSYLLSKKMKQYHKETQKVLKGMDEKMDQYHKEVKEILDRMEKTIIDAQQQLASKICSNINKLMKFSKQLQQSEVPKLVYFCNSQDGGLKNLLTRMVPGLHFAHLHLMCEHKNDIHIIDAQLGHQVRFGTNETKTFGTIMYWGLTLITMLLKVGAHVIAGAGGMVPDLTKDIMLILDAPGFFDLAQPTSPMVECLPLELRRKSTITNKDMKMAEDRLIRILKPICDSNGIHDKFKLSKVMYTEKSGKHAGAIAWVCDHHKKIGKNDGTLERI